LRRLRGGVARRQAAYFIAGCLVLALTVSPPVNEVSERLFSVHMAEHELLMAGAAPLLVLGQPLLVLLSSLPRAARRRVARWGAARPLRRAWLLATGPVIAWSVHTLALWLWHAPALFSAAIHSHVVHAAQHLCFLGAGLIYWSSLVANRHGASGYGTAVLSLFATSVQCALLSALLTVGTIPWYADYPALEDQQLAGLVMWVPAGVVYTGSGIAFFVAWLRESEARTRRWERSLPT
jgi:cytochrome c oxidase assembly factor CtaG